MVSSKKEQLPSMKNKFIQDYLPFQNSLEQQLK